MGTGADVPCTMCAGQTGESATAEAGGPVGLIQDDRSGAFGKARAIVIARTETGTAYNRLF